VVTYFGRPPFWLPAFLLSCRHNPDVRWLLYTDFEPTTDVPPNVTMTPMDIRELGTRASDALGTTIEPHRARRKVCDLKPAYGLIFADALRGFDFWAHSDLDIVWGNVRHFLTAPFLEQYDVVTSTFRKVAGHFGLFRNTPETNRTFELIPDIKTAMASRKYGHLDEDVLTQHLRAHVDQRPAPPWPRVYWERELTVTSKYQKAMSDAQSLWWRDGRTFDADGTELMYLHFHKLKPFMTGINFGPGDMPAAFMINRKGFIA
jgi:hypothetical protein